MLIIPEWAQSVGALIDEDAIVRAYCSHCDGAWTADLQRIAEARGRDYSLWNRTPRCKAPGCPGRVFFRCKRRDAGMWPLLMRDV